MAGYNLLLWKDPVDSWFSLKKRQHTYGSWRRQYLTYYRHVFSLDIPFLAVHFNSLAADPAGKLRAICEAVGIAYVPGREQFWEKQHHQSFGSRGTRQQVDGRAERRLRRQPDYPPDFQAQIPALAREMDGDVELQAVVRRLRQAEIGAEPSAAAPPGAWRRRRILPAWYYAKTAKALIRRRFPQHWDMPR